MVADKSARVKLDLERVDYWLSVGALPSDRVATLIKKLRAGRFGAPKPPPARMAPKPLAVPEAPAAEAPPEAEPAESAS
jgi:small subunit ribosomal protein S16